MVWTALLASFRQPERQGIAPFQAPTHSPAVWQGSQRLHSAGGSGSAWACHQRRARRQCTAHPPRRRTPRRPQLQGEAWQADTSFAKAMAIPSQVSNCCCTPEASSSKRRHCMRGAGSGGTHQQAEKQPETKTLQQGRTRGWWRSARRRGRPHRRHTPCRQPLQQAWQGVGRQAGGELGMHLTTAVAALACREARPAPLSKSRSHPPAAQASATATSPAQSDAQALALTL